MSKKILFKNILKIFLYFFPVIALIGFFIWRYFEKIDWMFIGVFIFTISFLSLSSWCFIKGLDEIQDLYKKIKINRKNKELNKIGKEICVKCEGSGCSFCKGEGKIDWIDRIVVAKIQSGII